MITDNIRAWYDFFDETQLFIVINNDITFDYPKPLPPNIISVEGTTIQDAKPLTQGNVAAADFSNYKCRGLTHVDKQKYHILTNKHTRHVYCLI